MNRRLYFVFFLEVLIVISLFLPQVLPVFGQAPTYETIQNPQASPVTAFTYQGQLKKNGSAYNGRCDLKFSLFDDPNAGLQLGSTNNILGKNVVDGLFTVQLDFGNQFDGTPRYLETSVKCAGDFGYTDLSPRTAINPTPFSISTGGLRGRTVSDAEPSIGFTLVWDGRQWSPSAVSQTERRQYYLTKDQFNGSQALTACAAGYHMASMAEILDPTNLKYNSSLGATWSDSGSGPPFSLMGWVRTGFGGSTTTQVGVGNCNVWTSSAFADHGTTIGLNPDWLQSSNLWPWAGIPAECNSPVSVWCVQD